MTETSPRRNANGDGDGSTSWPYLLLAPHTSIVSRSWRPVPSCLALWTMWASQAWPAMALGHVEARPFLSGVRSLTPDFIFCICGGWRQCGPPAGPAPPSEADRVLSGSGGAELPFLGSGEARPVLLGSGEAWPTPKGSNERNLCPKGRANQNLFPRGRIKPRSRPLIVRSILIVGDQ
jgi:hypothetical protein